MEEKTNAFETHIEIAKFQNVTVLLLCLCGMFLNAIMLVIFCTRKKVRGSVYTTYMIQIAITDLLVCIVWIVMASMYLDGLPSSSDIKDIVKSGFKDPESALQDTAAIESRNFSVYRFTYAIYNFHYYNNIFLLATMSVERCVAVWKSLRCQRYQFDRKFIYAVSVVMWLFAFACALPSFINPDLITQSEQSDLLLKNINETKYENSRLSEPSRVLLSCFKPLRHALDNNKEFVVDYGGVSVNDCVDRLVEYGLEFNDTLETIISVEEDINDSYSPTNSDSIIPEDLNNSYSLSNLNDILEELDSPGYNYDDSTRNQSDKGSTQIRTEDYQFFFITTSSFMGIVVRTADIDELCDPHLSTQAKYYQVIVNLVIGFFLPFIAILFTNVSIAIMIGKRARHRLGSDNDDAQEDSTVRRMSDFLKQFGQQSRTEGETSGIYKRSPKSKRKAKSRHHRNKNPQSKERKNLLVQMSKTPQGLKINLQPATPSTSPDHELNAKIREHRPRLSSLSTTQTRRTSGGSASSAESFPTDITSLHTTSPSPGVRLSAPLFLHSDGKVPVQRACSADSSTTGSGCTGNPTFTKRWSSEDFKGSTLEDERKLNGDKRCKDSESTLPNHKEAKIVSPMPSRVENTMGESTQELLSHGSHVRMYQPKAKKTNRQTSIQSNGRGRAHSGASRASGSGSRKTVVFKNAERQMRVSKSVLAYVLVFTICWLPQRIVTIMYFTEGFMNKSGYFCNMATSATRILSFLSVLLNPVVYFATQRELRHYIRESINRFHKCICPQKLIGRKLPNSKTFSKVGVQNQAGTSANENSSALVANNPSTADVTRQERHVRNKERWYRMVQRLGRKSLRYSVSASGVSTQGDKPSDGTIDEEREDERGQSSKGQSLSNSMKQANGGNGFEEWRHLMVDSEPAKEGNQQLNRETTL